MRVFLAAVCGALLLSACASNISVVDHWQPQGKRGDVLAMHAEYDPAERQITVIVEGTTAISGQFESGQDRAILYGDYQGRRLRAECERGLFGVDACFVYEGGDRIAKLRF